MHDLTNLKRIFGEQGVEPICKRVQFFINITIPTTCVFFFYYFNISLLNIHIIISMYYGNTVFK